MLSCLWPHLICRLQLLHACQRTACLEQSVTMGTRKWQAQCKKEVIACQGKRPFVCMRVVVWKYFVIQQFKIVLTWLMCYMRFYKGSQVSVNDRTLLGSIPHQCLTLQLCSGQAIPFNCLIQACIPARLHTWKVDSKCTTHGQSNSSVVCLNIVQMRVKMSKSLGRALCQGYSKMSKLTLGNTH